MLTESYTTIFEPVLKTILIIKSILKIPTPIIMLSSLPYNRNMQKGDLVLDICKIVNADVYFSGNGARKYMCTEAFKNEGVQVVYQEFLSPVYPQVSSAEFVPNLSTLDLLFNCGIAGAKEIFWNNVHTTAEFESLL